MTMLNVTFYKYVQIENPDQLKETLQDLCKSLNIMGRILLGSEGINAAITGEEKSIELFESAIKEVQEFSDIDFKKTITKGHDFKKLTIRIKKEIVTSRFEGVKIEKKANYIEPKELKRALDNKEDVILVDARNDYEYKIGRFRNAINPEIKIFREWPEAVKKLNEIKEIENKKIVTYCTGGIRCEKASAYLQEQGFDNVFQLHGGIIKYGLECGDTHWEGKCFVFDNRGAVSIDPNKNADPVSQCNLCKIPSDTYHNCSVIECDKRFISCEKCFNTLQGCCSKMCRNSNKIKREIEINSFS